MREDRMSQEQPENKLPRAVEPLAGLQTVKRGLDTFLLWTGYMAGILFALLAFFITYDVLARKWGDMLGLPTTRVTDEISGYIMALAVTWGFAYTLRSNGHVRIDVLLPHLPARIRGVVDFLALVSTGFMACLFAWKVWVLVLDSWQSGMRSSTYLLTPMWIPQGILGIGFSFLAIAAVFTPVCELVEGIVLRHRAATAENSAGQAAYGDSDGVSLRPE
jgi:TRAP-type mannitol/chloroaromatic compound transport system permease small subunit